MVRTSTRSGGVHQPSSVSLLVSRSIANVKKCFKAEHAKAKRAQVSAKRTEEEQKRQQRYVEKCAKLRRQDAEVVEKLETVLKWALEGRWEKAEETYLQLTLGNATWHSSVRAQRQRPSGVLEGV